MSPAAPAATASPAPCDPDQLRTELPAAMREAKRWIVWRLEPNPDPAKRPLKVPYYLNGSKRHGTLDSAKDLARLGTFGAMLATLASGDYTGPGFALGADGPHYWQGVDLDGTTDKHPELVPLVDLLPGYVEWSPSGTGVHAIGRGQPISPSLGSNGTGIEAYGAGRFFTVTGHAIGGDLADLAPFVRNTLEPLHRAGKVRAVPDGAAPEAPKVTARTVRDLRSALAAIDADGREVWVAMGLALKSLGDQGRALWLEWSQSSAKYDAADAARVWASFTPQQTDYRAVFAEAQRGVWVNPGRETPAVEDPPPPSAADAGNWEPVPDWEGYGPPDNVVPIRPPAPAAPAESPPESRLRPVDLTRLRGAELPAPTFMVEPLIPRGHLTLLGGHGGSGKSVLAITIGAHVACGRDWAGLGVTRGRVLFVSFEDEGDLVLWRLRRIAEEYALNFDELIQSLSIIDATTADPIMYESSEGGVRHVLPSHDGAELHTLICAEQYELVIIDNASDAFDGDENHRRQVRSFVRHLVSSIKPHRGAMLLLAHIDKAAARAGSNKNTYSGSTGWHNSARSRLALLEGELVQEKLNVGKPLQMPIKIAWTQRAVLIPAGRGGSVSAQAALDEADEDALLACFRAATQAGRTVPAAESGTATTWHALSVYPECPKFLKEDKARLREGIARLLRSGLILIETYHNIERKPKERLILNPLMAPERANQT
jgi:hypothetical protein